MALQRAPFSLYHYTPNKTVTILMLVLFGTSTALHVLQAIYHRMWYLFPTVVLCGLLELLGWSGRLWSSQNPVLVLPFQLQMAGTVLGPTPLLAANFLIFESIVERLGTKYSRLGTRWYTVIFCTFDVISLAVQSVGGGHAAAALSKNQDAQPGARIMLGGICFQLVVITLFSLSSIEYFIRYRRDWPVPQLFGRRPLRAERLRGEMGKNIFMLTAGLIGSTLLLFIRAIYRVVELSEGWGGPIARNEVLFNVLDGAMVIIAFYQLNILHPGYLLKGTSPLYFDAKDESGGKESGETNYQLVGMDRN